MASSHSSSPVPQPNSRDAFFKKEMDSAKRFRPVQSLPDVCPKEPTGDPNSLSDSPSLVADQHRWTIYHSKVNLPAALNDPRLAKRESDFFTKTWGQDFVDTEVAPSFYLPQINKENFALYQQEIIQREKIHERCKNICPPKDTFDRTLLHTHDYRKAMSQAGTSQFQEVIRQELEYSMKVELDKILATAPQNELEHTKKDLEGFKKLFHRFLQEKGPSVDWGKIQRPPEDSIQPYEKIRARGLPVNITSVLNKLVVVKLNGGLGTSMGCKGPKSLIGVRNENTFLDLTVQQIEHLNKTYNTDVPLVLMNSFNTDEDTKKILQKYSHSRVKIYTFNQSRYPRINKESLLPIAKDVSYSGENTEAWYPPGHGDIYSSFYNSGLLDTLIGEGKEYIFVSNIDNLGATVDLYILNHLMNPPNGKCCEFVMEVTNKTRADVKGGTLTQYDNKLRLVEIAQVPKAHVDEFKSVSKFKIFNTNNLWISLPAIKRLQEQNAIDMEIIVNPKTLDGGLNVIQLETAVGAAVKSFENSLGINVPRSRFLPVKTTSDLLLVMSNLYSLNAGSLTMSEKREFPTVPLVKLGSSFTKVQDYLTRFESIPDMLELDHLTVSGDVTFGKNVALKGTVIIIANHGDRIDIPPGAVLENKIVSGNLRILDH